MFLALNDKLTSSLDFPFTSLDAAQSSRTSKVLGCFLASCLRGHNGKDAVVIFGKAIVGLVVYEGGADQSNVVERTSEWPTKLIKKIIFTLLVVPTMSALKEILLGFISIGWNQAVR